MVAYGTPTTIDDEEDSERRIRQWMAEIQRTQGATPTGTPVPAAGVANMARPQAQWDPSTGRYETGAVSASASPSPQASGTPTSTGIPELDRLIAAKGSSPLNLKNPILSKESREDWAGTTTQAVFRYKWADGDYVDVWADTKQLKDTHTPVLDKQNQPQKEALPKSVSASRTNQKIVRQDAEGNLITEDNPNYAPSAASASVDTVSAPSGQKYIGRWDPEAKKVVWEENPNYSDAADQQARLSLKMAEIRAGLESQQYSVDKAKQLAAQAQDEYNRWYQSQSLEQRNLDRASSERGTNIGAAVNLGNAALDASMGSLPYIAPRGSMANFDKAIASLGSGSSAPVQYGPTPTAPFPFNPATLATTTAQGVLGTSGGQVLPANTPMGATQAPAGIIGGINAANQQLNAQQQALIEAAMAQLGGGGTAYRAPVVPPTGWPDPRTGEPMM